MSSLSTELNAPKYVYNFRFNLFDKSKPSFFTLIQVNMRSAKTLLGITNVIQLLLVLQ